jgi:hypothetical protein
MLKVTLLKRWHHFYEWYRARKQRTVLVWVADHKCNVINHIAWVLSHISKVINHIFENLPNTKCECIFQPTFCLMKFQLTFETIFFFQIKRRKTKITFIEEKKSNMQFEICSFVLFFKKKIGSFYSVFKILNRELI